MTKRSKLWFLPVILVITDIVMINLSFLLAYWIRFPLGLIGEEYRPVPPIQPYLKAMILISFVWVLIFHFLGLYKIRRNPLIIDELFDIAKGITVGILIVMALSFLYRDFSYSRLVAFIAWFINIFLIVSGRIMIKQVQQMLLKKGIGTMKIIIIGATEQGNIVFERIKKFPQLGYEIVGFIDDNLPKTKSCHIIGKISQLPELIRNYSIDEVIIALPSTQREKILECVIMCEAEKVKFLIVPDFYDLITTKVGTYEIDGIPFVGLKELPLDKLGNRCIKRAMDIIIAFIALIISAPIMLIIGLLIKLDSKGTIIFKQTRVGIDGKHFTMFKFRSMYTGAELEDNKVGLGLENDLRETKIGSFLRKTGLDELPQIFNVLKGNMSIVGPRPERLYWVNKFKDQIPRYTERHSIKTGITGWSQVNGLRGNTSLQERIKYDLYYIENWNVWFDIKIIIMTLFNYHFVRGQV